MGTRYDDIAGQSLEWMAALSDGVFAMAMTLLVLDLRAPAAEAVHGERAGGRAAGTGAPAFVVSDELSDARHLLGRGSRRS